MSLEAVLSLFLAGAALVALWLVVRFPGAGPQRVVTAAAAIPAALGLLSVAPWLVGVVAGAEPYGVLLAVTLVVLPSLTGVFWVAGCLIRAIARLGGSTR